MQNKHAVDGQPEQMQRFSSAEKRYQVQNNTKGGGK